jgi:hypothetical protein
MVEDITTREGVDPLIYVRFRANALARTMSTAATVRWEMVE